MAAGGLLSLPEGSEGKGKEKSGKRKKILKARARPPSSQRLEPKWPGAVRGASKIIERSRPFSILYTTKNVIIIRRRDAAQGRWRWRSREVWTGHSAKGIYDHSKLDEEDPPGVATSNGPIGAHTPGAASSCRPRQSRRRSSRCRPLSDIRPSNVKQGLPKIPLSAHPDAQRPRLATILGSPGLGSQTASQP